MVFLPCRTESQDAGIIDEGDRRIELVLAQPDERAPLGDRLAVESGGGEVFEDVGDGGRFEHHFVTTGRQLDGVGRGAGLGRSVGAEGSTIEFGERELGRGGPRHRPRCCGRCPTRRTRRLRRSRCDRPSWRSCPSSSWSGQKPAASSPPAPSTKARNAPVPVWPASPPPRPQGGDRVRPVRRGPASPGRGARPSPRPSHARREPGAGSRRPRLPNPMPSGRRGGSAAAPSSRPRPRSGGSPSWRSGSTPAGADRPQPRPRLPARPPSPVPRRTTRTPARRSRPNPDPDVAEAGGGRRMSGVTDLARFALAAVRCAPHHDLFLPRRQHVHRRPAIWATRSPCTSDSEQPAELAVLDLVADLGAELEVQPAVVDRPRPVRFHVDAIVGRGDDLVERVGTSSSPTFVIRTIGSRAQPSARTLPA